MRREHLRELAELGKFLDSVVELDDGDGVIRIGTPVLCWSAKGSALVVFAGYKLPALRAAAELPAIPARVVETWTQGREATRERQAELELPAGRWRDLGPARSIGYRSDKFHARGQLVDYDHKFTTAVRAYQLGGGSRCVFAWRGGRLRITRRGIEG